MSGEEEEEGGGALSTALPDATRLWAAVDVKETPQEFVLSTDVRARIARACAQHHASSIFD